jgi:hypothetical protein
MIPIYCAADDLNAGALVQVLGKYQVPRKTGFRFVPHSKLVAATTRAFIKFLVSWFKGAPSPLRATTDEVLSGPSFGEVEHALHNGFAKPSSPRAHSKNR